MCLSLVPVLKKDKSIRLFVDYRGSMTWNFQIRTQYLGYKSA